MIIRSTSKFLIVPFFLAIQLSCSSQNLHEAACAGDVATMEELLKDGIDINLKDEKGSTALKKAISCEQPKAIEYLLTNKADPNSPDSSDRTLLYQSAHNNDTQLVALLLANNADVNKGDKNSIYPIHKSVLNENLQNVKALVMANADVNVQTNRGNTSLDLALREGYSKIADFLMANGAQKRDTPTQFGGMYLDTTLPGNEPQLFAYNFISTENKTQNAIFHPNGMEYYYTVETINNPGIIRVSRFLDGIWTKPEPAPISGISREVDPFITPDGSQLFFCWDEPAAENDDRERNMDIWVMNREGDKWSAPQHIGFGVNTDEHDWFPTVSNKGTLFYSTGKFPESNIYYSELKNGAYQKSVLMNDALNTEHRDFAPFIAPDESYIIFSSNRSGGVGDSDLYISFKNSDGSWAKAKNMGETINSPVADFGPSLSLDGKYLFFTSWREGTASDVYWVDAKIIETLKQ